MAYEPFITADVENAKKLVTVDIPYGEYVIRMSLTTDPTGYVRDNEKLEILAFDGTNTEDATHSFLPNIIEGRKVGITGDNLMKIMAMVFNEVNKDQ